MRRFLRNYRVSVPTIAAGLGVLAWVVFGYFGAHLLFVDDRVDEAAPVFPAAAASPEPANTLEQPASSVPAALDTAGPSSTTAVATTPTTAPTATTATTATTDPVAVGASAAAETTTTSAPPTAPAAPVVTTLRRGEFVSLAHPTSGTALVLGDGGPVRFLRFEGFETDNGPDLNVYLINGATGDESDFVDLGNLKGNIGDQNYEIPSDVDLSVYDTALIWCVRFSSGFGEAQLTPL